MKKSGIINDMNRKKVHLERGAKSQGRELPATKHRLQTRLYFWTFTVTHWMLIITNIFSNFQLKKLMLYSGWTIRWRRSKKQVSLHSAHLPVAILIFHVSFQRNNKIKSNWKNSHQNRVFSELDDSEKWGTEENKMVLLRPWHLVTEMKESVWPGKFCLLQRRSMWPCTEWGLKANKAEPLPLYHSPQHVCLVPWTLLLWQERVLLKYRTYIMYIYKDNRSTFIWYHP